MLVSENVLACLGTTKMNERRQEREADRLLRGIMRMRNKIEAVRADLDISDELTKDRIDVHVDAIEGDYRRYKELKEQGEF